MPILDLTRTLKHQMDVFPGEMPPSLIEDPLPETSGYITYRWESNMHTGTHIDAPMHAKADRITIDQYPLELFTGKACCIDVRGRKEVKMNTEWEKLFASHEVILFCTGHSAEWGNPVYYNDYPVIEDAIAMAINKSGVRIVGVDSPSPDQAPFRFHSLFLRERHFLVENLTNLEQLIGIGSFEFSAFPLKIQAEASLIRAVARY